jgi:hypothetical protein
MFNFKKLFGKGKQEQIPSNTEEEGLPWIEPADNPWNIKLLDLRPITHKMVSTSSDPRMAANAVSYGGEDGTVFWGQKPKIDKTVATNLTIPIDGTLAPGVLFMPNAMEHKWAMYFDGEHLIFVRSWQREVFVVAKTVQKNNELIVENIYGEFVGNETPAFTKAVLNFLLISHSIGEIIPAPLPKELEVDTKNAGFWAFSIYGNMAQVGTFDENFIPKAKSNLRSHSLLHIAVARGDIAEIEKLVQQGININSLAGDGLATLHWAIASVNIEPMQKLLSLGADPNVTSFEGATPIMNAVQSNKIDKLNLLLNAGALVNFRDKRGFTALHRAAEMGHIEIVKMLLANGADKSIEAEKQTALSLAQARDNKEIIDLLS